MRVPNHNPNPLFAPRPVPRDSRLRPEKAAPAPAQAPAPVPLGQQPAQPEPEPEPEPVNSGRPGRRRLQRADGQPDNNGNAQPLEEEADPAPQNQRPRPNNRRGPAPQGRLEVIDPRGYQHATWELMAYLLIFLYFLWCLFSSLFVNSNAPIVNPNSPVVNPGME